MTYCIAVKSVGWLICMNFGTQLYVTDILFAEFCQSVQGLWSSDIQFLIDF